jgi:peptidoglycan/LPS O-acetylase OafA/YrhL
MQNRQKKTIITWLKRFLGFLAIGVWMYVIFTISKSPTPFREQVPYCMISTMMIFGFLSMGFKGLEYWETQQEEQKNEEKNR